MHAAKRILWIAALALALLVLAGCGGGGDDDSNTDLMKTLLPGDEAGGRPTAMPLPPTWTPVPTLTEAPRPTYEVTRRPTATWFVPGTRISPQTAAEVITPDNAATLIQVGIQNDGLVNDLAWSADGQTLAVAKPDGVRLYPNGDLSSQPRLLKVAQPTGLNEAECVAFSPDGTTAATGNKEGEIRLWDLNTQTERNMWQLEDITIFDCVFTSDGAMLVTAGSHNRIDVWNPASGEAIKTYESASYDTYSLAVYPLNAPILVSGGNSEPPQVWDLGEGTELAAPAGHAFTVRAVAFSPNGETFATGDNGGTVRLWTVASAQQGEPLSVLESPDSQIISLAYNPASTLIAVGYLDGKLRIWGISQGQLVLETAAHSNWVGPLSWSPDGTRLYTASLDGSLRVWAVGSGQ